MTTSDPDRLPIIPALIGVAALVVTCLGMVGFREVDPSLGFLDSLYLSVQLFVLNVEITNPPPVLNVARFGALAISGYAIIQVILVVLRRRVRLTRELLRKNHTVVMGSGPEIVPLAGSTVASGDARSTVAIGDIPEDARSELRSFGIRHWQGLSNWELAAVLKGAQGVLVSGSSDQQTARLLARVRHADSDVPAYALFDSPALTREWLSDSAHVGVEPRCRVTQVAIATLRQSPPYGTRVVSPEPLVIGEGPLANELLRRIVTGWQRPGWRPHVHCITPDPNLALDLIAEGFGQALEIIHEPRLTPHTAEALAERLDSAWTPPRKGKGQAGPLHVYITLNDEGQAAAIARALITMRTEATPSRPAPTVTLIVQETGTWEALFDDADPQRIRLIARDSLLGNIATLKQSASDLLKAELLAFIASRPETDDPVFAPGTDDQSVDVMVRNAAHVARQILASGGMKAVPGGEPSLDLSIGPDELRAMASRLGAAVPLAQGTASSASMPEAGPLELVARLPHLMQRAGWRVTTENPFPLTPEDIDVIAEHLHTTYQKTVERLGNPTRSATAESDWPQLSEFMHAENRAVVLDFPVKLALLGRSWRMNPDPHVIVLSHDEVEKLAEAEHRRWWYQQRLNGRDDHEMMKPWAALTMDQKESDRDNVRKVPWFLASVGIEIITADSPPGPGDGPSSADREVGPAAGQ